MQVFLVLNQLLNVNSIVQALQALVSKLKEFLGSIGPAALTQTSSDHQEEYWESDELSQIHFEMQVCDTLLV